MSPPRAQYGFYAAALEQDQVGWTVAACHAGFMAGSNLVPVVAGFGAAWSARVVYCAMPALGGWRRGGEAKEIWVSLLQPTHLMVHHTDLS